MKAAVLAMIVSSSNPQLRSPRELVNKAGELWDELDHQTKDPDEGKE
jgi:hypothetical protein